MKLKGNLILMVVAQLRATLLKGFYMSKSNPSRGPNEPYSSNLIPKLRETVHAYVMLSRGVSDNLKMDDIINVHSLILNVDFDQHLLVNCKPRCLTIVDCIYCYFGF